MLDNVGDKVRTARVRRGMTLGGLARASGLTKGFISQVEHGRSKPSLKSLGRIASSLDLSLPSLLGGQDGMAVEQPGPYPLATFSLTPARDAKAGIEPLISGPAGSFAVAYLTRGARLAPAGQEQAAPAPEAERPGTPRAAQAFCVVLDGEAVFAQDGAERTLKHGDALAWDAGRGYAIENRRDPVCALVISVVAGGELPVASLPAPAAQASPGMTVEHVPAPPVEGPLRLVAMRAQRRGSRGR